MSLQTVLASITFWSEDETSSAWNISSTDKSQISSETSPEFQEDFLHYIEVLYNGSQTMRDLLDEVSSNPVYVAEYVAGPGRSFTDSTPPFIAVNFSKIDEIGSFNDHGQWVPELPELVIAHEFAHRYWTELDLSSHFDPQPDAVLENVATFDNKGDMVRFQNTVAGELGYDDAIRSSYLSSGDIGNFVLWENYSKGKEIDISRIAHQGYPLDTSLRTDSSKDLLLGTIYDDTMKSGDGKDYLWGFEGHDTLEGGDGYDLLVGDTGDDILRGGEGNDQILAGDNNDILDAGSGDDFLVGRDGSDTLIGGAGNDEIWGGNYEEANSSGADIADYSDSDGRIKIILREDGSLVVHDGYGGMDTLHAIDNIVGTEKRDTFTLEGSISASMDTITIDATGGQGADPSDTINLAASTSKISLLINNDGDGHIFDIDKNAYIYLEGFHTNLIGSYQDDIVVDQSTGKKQIYSAGGNDEVTIGGGSGLIDGGAGDDQITGGSYNDILVGGSGVNIFTGGAGSDHIISSSSGDLIDAGDGHDYISIREGVAQATIKGGHGNDVVDAGVPFQIYIGSGVQYPGSSNPTLEYHFSKGDGHDVLLGGYFSAELGAADVLASETIPQIGKVSVGHIRLIDINLSDVSFKWDIVDTYVEQTDDDDWVKTFVGDMAIVIESTGDSIYLGRVAGALNTDDPNQPLENLHVVNILTLPEITFADGKLETFDDWYLNAWIEVGSVSQYNTALAEFAAATSLGNGGEIEGTTGDDVLTGGSGDESIDAGDGNDDVELSGGSDEVDGGNGTDQLTTFGSMVGFTFERQGDGSVIVTSLNGLEGRTKIVNVENIYSITDDQTSDLSSLAGEYGTPDDDSLINGTVRADFLFGLEGDDTIRGGVGSDVIDGGDGTDIASYLGDSLDYRAYIDVDGSVKVQDLVGDDGRDKLTSIEALHFGGDNVTILPSALPALGTTAGDALAGDARANYLFGLEGDDSLDGGAGSDILEGGVGSDTYIVNASGGNDIVIETAHQNSDEDVLDFTDFDPEDLTFYRGITQETAGDLFVKIIATGEITTIKGQFADWQDQGIERIDFDASVSWDRSQIAVSALSVGTAGADTIYGSPVGGTIAGNGGDDIVHSFGADTIVYNATDGSLDIVDHASPFPQMYLDDVDTLHFTDLTENDLTFVRQGRDFIITVVATSETITIRNQSNIEADWSTASGQRLEYIRFGTDEPIDAETIFAAASVVAMNGSANADPLTGTLYDDEIHGGGGNDIIYGLDGPDLLDGGDGNDEIHSGGAGSILSGGNGDDSFSNLWGVTVDGGDGTDTAIFDGRHSDYGFVFETDGSLTVTFKGWLDTETVGNFSDTELLKFTQNNVTLSAADLSFVGNPEPQFNWSLGDEYWERGDSLFIEISTEAFVDPNDATLTYSATLSDGSPLPTWLTLTDREFSGSVPTTIYGPIGIIVTASDGENSASDQFTLFIANSTSNEIYAVGTEYGTSDNDLMFADGNSTIDLYGADGDDTLRADANEVSLHGDLGNDILQASGIDTLIEGGAGYDHFIFDYWSFNDEPSSTDTWATIEDFEDGIDKIGVFGIGATFASIESKMTQVGTDVQIAMASMPKIFILGTDIEDLDSSDFLFDPIEQGSMMLQQSLWAYQPDLLLA